MFKDLRLGEKKMNKEQAFVQRSMKLVRSLMPHSISLLSQVNSLLGIQALKVSQYSILKVAYEAFIRSVQ